MRGGAVAARRAHNPEVLGSNPSPATEGVLRSLQPETTRAVLASVVNPNPFSIERIFIIRWVLGPRGGDIFESKPRY